MKMRIIILGYDFEIVLEKNDGKNHLWLSEQN
jgi:hypothetical protein